MKARQVLSICLIAILIVLLVSNLFSQWKKVGPCGGWITCMKSIPQKPLKMFCGTLQGGAYFSDDRGENWDLIPEMCEYNPVYDLSISEKGDVYFATRNGLFLTRNSGLTWKKIFNAPAWQVVALSDSIVAADTARWQYLWDGNRHPTNSLWLISFDSGQSWKFWEGTVDSSITSPNYLRPHEKRGSIIITPDDQIFRTEGLRIFKIINEDWTEWQHVNDFDPWLSEWCQAFLVADDAGSTCYAFAEYYDFHPAGGFYGGIFQSNDDWQSWGKITKIRSATALTVGGSHLLIGESKGVEFNTNSKLILYKTAVDSTKELAQFSGDITAIDALGWEFGELIVATESGIFRTSDFGATWQNSSNGIHRINAVAVQTIPIDQTSERIILAVHKGGIWSSINCGSSWKHVAITPYILPGLLEKTPHNPEYLYAGGSLFFRSRDAGNSWYEPPNYDFPAAYYNWYGRFVDIAIDPFDPKHIMVHFDDHSMDHSRGILCAESFDRGTSWTERIWFSTEYNYSLNAAFDSRLNRLWISNQGYRNRAIPALMVIDSTWQEPIQMITLPDSLVASFWCVNGDTIFVMNAGNAKFFRSDDLGENWFENDLGDFSYNYYWYDWAVYEQIGQLSLAPDKKGIFFVYPGTGVLYSRDKGESWRELNDGLPTRNSYHLDFSTINPNMIYLATDNGFYQFDLLTGVEWQNENFYENNQKNCPSSFTFYNNYPNPFNSTTTISLYLNRSGDLTISIYNLLGQEIERLVDHQFTHAGKHDIPWEATCYTSGVFIVKVTFNDRTYIRKALLIK